MIGLAIVLISLIPTSRSQVDRPTVCLEQHNRCLIGTQMTDLEGIAFEAYLGIPFAQAPIGRLRFAVNDFSTLLYLHPASHESF